MLKPFSNKSKDRLHFVPVLILVHALQIWDLGGQANLRPSWAAYCKNTDAVVMVVDSTDRARVSTNKVRLKEWFVVSYQILSSSTWSTRTEYLVYN